MNDETMNKLNILSLLLLEKNNVNDESTKLPYIDNDYKVYLDEELSDYYFNLFEKIKKIPNGLYDIRRIDLLFVLMENVLFSNGKIILDLKIKKIDYINIVMLFFEYLDNYYSYNYHSWLPNIDENIIINDISINKLINIINGKIRNKKDYDSNVAELNRLIELKINPFSKKMVSEYLKLYFYVK